MTRVANLAQNQFLTGEALRTQKRVFETQQQVTSGKKASRFEGIARDTITLLGAKSLDTRTQQFISSANELKTRLVVVDANLLSVYETGDRLRQGLLDGIASGSGTALMAVVEDSLVAAINALNSQHAGQFIFGGTRSDAPPVTISGLADLAAAPAVADVFQNATLKQSMQIDSSLVVEHGVLASDVAQPLFQVIKDIEAFNAGPDGPIDGPLTPAQEAFLKTQVANLIAANDVVNQAVAKNGVVQARIGEVIERHERSLITIRSFIGDIEDANIPEAVTRLNEDRSALEIQFRVLAQLSSLTLGDFL